jgi:mediator of RNA polymerase II transcription subunit 5
MSALFTLTCRLTGRQLETDVFTSGGRSVSSGFLRSTAIVHRLEDLSGENAVAFNAWYKALFDRSSEGIEDTILRSSRSRSSFGYY